MDLARPLALITPTVDGDVLAVLARANASFTGRQVHQVAGRHSERGVRNALQRLSAQGIVTRERVGSADLYQLNRAHLAAPYVEAMARLRDELLHRLAGEFKRWSAPAVFAAVFGSAARGGMHSESDIDLLVVRADTVDPDDPGWRDHFDALASTVTAWTGNDARILEFGAREAEEGLVAGDGVLLAARREGIVVHGPLTYLSESPRRCTDAIRAGRMAKAAQFHLAAETIVSTLDDQDMADAYVMLCVHAGIAAADAICCARLGQHSQGDDHQEAVALLSKADRTQAKHLKVLLDMKTRSGYSAVPTSQADQKRAGRAAAELVRSARASRG